MQKSHHKQTRNSGEDDAAGDGSGLHVTVTVKTKLKKREFTESGSREEEEYILYDIDNIVKCHRTNFIQLA